MVGKLNRLSARGVATLSKPGRHADGGNLYLNVTATGARSWVFMYKFAGRQREMGLGSAQDVPLAKARVLAMDARRGLAEGKDPLALRKKIETPTFGAVADELIESMEHSWRNEKHRYQWRQTLGDQYVASLRKTPVDQILTEHILEVLKPIWIDKAETAARLRGRIERVLDAAKAKGYRSGDNPARWRGHLANLLPKRHKLTRGHHAAMAIDDVPAFLQELKASQGVSGRALEFTVLTAARTGEVLGMRWTEVDFTRGLWIIPGERMKAGVEHRVPLAGRAKAILKDMEKIKTGPLVFPGAKTDRPLSNMAMTMLLRRYADVTVHGFRSAFRDWAAERTSFSHEVCEMALAHTIASEIERAYRRGDLFDKRRELMESWANFCEPQDHKVEMLPDSGAKL